MDYAIVGRRKCHFIGLRDGSHWYVVNEYAAERTLQNVDTVSYVEATEQYFVMWQELILKQGLLTRVCWPYNQDS